MRRLRLRTGPAALFGAMLVVALLIFLPMRLVLGWTGAGEQGLVARSVTGSVWGATLSEARFGDLSLGDVGARLSPLPLLVGRATLSLEGPGGQGAPPLSGRAFVSRHAAGIAGFTGRLAAGAAFQPLPVVALDLDDVTARFEDDACIEAAGRVRAVLAGDVAGIALPPSIEGTARCDAGALLLPLASAAGTEAVSLRITGAGRYRADLSIRPADPAAVERLVASGFTQGAGGYGLSVEGRF
ncbi:type II secretion system protein N [Sphingomonas rubra]|uniref:Type II secretion system protein N n=1 Tax=Sphingomonas rubra TaxID=634430 RepID=A0A1I5SW36_9SPHN|nr:type II secretion system protein N [Sphingomonas rubra]SFP74436.1 general secretion pathway protein N [Sphingomonas rubra]